MLGSDVDAALLRPARWRWRRNCVCRCGWRRRRPVVRIRPQTRVFAASSRRDRLAFRLLHGHDVVLVVGAPVFRYHQYEPGHFWQKGPRWLTLSCDPQEAARAPDGEGGRGRLRLTLEALVEVVGSSRRSMPAAAAEAPAPAPQTEGERIGAGRCVRHCGGGGARAMRSMSTNQRRRRTLLWDRLPMREPGSYFFPAAGGLGFGIPVALGVQLGCLNAASSDWSVMAPRTSPS